jgi:hypothetical protein
MADGSWDNSGMPAPKRGMSVWAKVGLGCGAAFLLFAVTCGSCVWMGTQKFTGTLDKSWSKMRANVESLRTEEGTKALYRGNPGLKESYPTEEEFLNAASEWRPKLEVLPAKRPDIKALFQNQKMEINANSMNGRNTVHIRYQMNNGNRLTMDTENDKLIDIRVQ